MIGWGGGVVAKERCYGGWVPSAWTRIRRHPSRKLESAAVPPFT